MGLYGRTNPQAYVTKVNTKHSLTTVRSLLLEKTTPK
jgi:hypothetical protein